MQAGLSAVDGVEVAAEDQRLAVASGAGGGLRVSDDAVAVDCLTEQLGVALGVGGEVRDLFGRDLGGVHAGDALAFV